MKEFILDKNVPFKLEKSKIWTMFDILKSENISTGDYQVILFLLSAYKDGFLSCDFTVKNKFFKASIITNHITLIVKYRVNMPISLITLSLPYEDLSILLRSTL